MIIYLLKIILCDLSFMSPKLLFHPCRWMLTPLIKGNIIGGSRVGPQMLSTWEMFTRSLCQPWAGAYTSLMLTLHLVLSRFTCLVWANNSARWSSLLFCLHFDLDVFFCLLFSGLSHAATALCYWYDTEVGHWHFMPWCWTGIYFKLVNSPSWFVFVLVHCESCLICI